MCDYCNCIPTWEDEMNNHEEIRLGRNKMKQKFCVHISGSDDLIPVHDMAEAVRAAAYLNAEYLSFYQSQDHGDIIPACFATPAVWPSSDESHENSLKELIADTKDKAPHWMCCG